MIHFHKQDLFVDTDHGGAAGSRQPRPARTNRCLASLYLVTCAELSGAVKYKALVAQPLYTFLILEAVVTTVGLIFN